MQTMQQGRYEPTARARGKSWRCSSASQYRGKRRCSLSTARRDYWLRGACLGANSTAHSSQLSGWSRDRKSTRLNSSHSQISYAVFCLKKKKKKRTKFPEKTKKKQKEQPKI